MRVAVVDLQSKTSDFLIGALGDAGLILDLNEDASLEKASVILLLVGEARAEAVAQVSRFRLLHPHVSQLVLCDEDDVEFRIATYEAGSDDCMSRPFHLRELVAKLRALGRRSPMGAATPLLPQAAVAIDLVALELRCGGREVKVTKREADLVITLGRAGGRVVRREEVLRDAWDAAPGVAANLVDVYVGYVRRKLDEIDADVRIKSARGEGFFLAPR